MVLRTFEGESYRNYSSSAEPLGCVVTVRRGGKVTSIVRDATGDDTFVLNSDLRPVDSDKKMVNYDCRTGDVIVIPISDGKTRVVEVMDTFPDRITFKLRSEDNRKRGGVSYAQLKEAGAFYLPGLQQAVERAKIVFEFVRDNCR